MVWCPNCLRDCRTDRDHASGYICCSECGRIHYQDVFTEEPTFVKGPGGESRLAGSFVKSIQSDYSESFRRTLENGSKQIKDLMIKLNIPDESLGGQAASFYRIAVERSFTRGRRTAYVAAACLYIACSYVLGGVYLQLCKLLSLEEHPFIQKPVDPSLFMHRFASALMKDDYKNKVWRTALKIVASMKRDWMQTGRKPSGICGAALYISALSHGFSYPKSDVLKVVHICEVTLTKRLIEFENTESGSLTIEEFEKNAEEFEKENRSSTFAEINSQESGTMEVLCQHKGKEPHFAHGLCRSCYKDFVELSGGLNGGSEPPAFQHAEMKRLAQASAQKEGGPEKEANQGIDNYEKVTMTEPASVSATENLDRNCEDRVQKDKEIPSVSDETDNFSEIDDAEVDCYLNTAEESRYKKIIWEEMNKEYLQEQAAKEAASAVSKDVGEATEDVVAARKLAAAAAAAVAKKSREKRDQKRALDSKNAGPALTAAEATRQMLTRKGLSSKINYDVLEKLFDVDLPAISSTKKSRMEESHDEKKNTSGQQAKKEDNENKISNDREGNEVDDTDEFYKKINQVEEMLHYDQDNFDDY